MPAKITAADLLKAQDAVEKWISTMLRAAFKLDVARKRLARYRRYLDPEYKHGEDLTLCHECGKRMEPDSDGVFREWYHPDCEPKTVRENVGAGCYVFKGMHGTWRVMWKGMSCSPEWNDKGAADAYLDMLKRGERDPEYAHLENRK